jgi:hypothetical protein
VCIDTRHGARREAIEASDTEAPDADLSKAPDVDLSKAPDARPFKGARRPTPDHGASGAFGRAPLDGRLWKGVFGRDHGARQFTACRQTPVHARARAQTPRHGAARDGAARDGAARDGARRCEGTV